MSNHSLKLSEARERTPKVSAIEVMRQQLQLELFGAVGTADVQAIATKLKEMAMAGDLKAMRLFFQLVTAQEKQPREPQPVINIQRAVVELQESVAKIQNALVVPTDAPQGSAERIRVLQERVEMGVATTHPDDAPYAGRAALNGRKEDA